MELKNENQICQNCSNEFLIEKEDFEFYAKLGVPAPTWCPHCRFIRKATFINLRTLYKRNCGNCKKSIISMYHPDTAFPVFCITCHLSDAWDAREYGGEYDFSKTFFDQFHELKNSVPHRALSQNERNGEGCEYSNFCFTSKDIYLSFMAIGSEHIKYSQHVLKHNKNCLDSLIFKNNEGGYELVQASTNYNSSFLIESDRCVDSQFLYDCSNCTNCCLSSNLRNKSYIFKNQQLTKEEYEKTVTELKLDTYSGQQKAKEEFIKIKNDAIHKYANIKNSVNATGDFIGNSKNVYQSYCLVSAENIKYAYLAANTIKDSQDLFLVGKLEECYEFMDGGRGANRAILSFGCGGGSKNMFYSDNCRGCSDCFGCVGLDKKQYCILNKQYIKEEYFDMIEKIKYHMNEMPYIDSHGRVFTFGEFFPTDLSPFAYNETVALEEEPLTKEEAIAKGYRWREIESNLYTPTITADDISDSIQDISDSITAEIIECLNEGKRETRCTGAFRILTDELSFYKQMKLPIPRYCPNCRYHDRLKWINRYCFYKRECMCELTHHEHAGKCQNNFETMYSPDRTEKIYCKDCYQKEVY